MKMKDYTKLTVHSKRPVQARGNERIRLILQKSAELFSVKGVASVTTNEIAVAASIPIGSIYTYFENKDKILESLLELYQQELSAVFAKIESNPLLKILSWHEVLVLIVYAWSDYVMLNKPLNYIVYARSAPELKSSVIAGRIKLQNSFCTIFHNKIPKNNQHDSNESLCKIVLLQLTAIVEYTQVMPFDEKELEKFIDSATFMLADNLSKY